MYERVKINRIGITILLFTSQIGIQSVGYPLMSLPELDEQVSAHSTEHSSEALNSDTGSKEMCAKLPNGSANIHDHAIVLQKARASVREVLCCAVDNGSLAEAINRIIKARVESEDKNSTTSTNQHSLAELRYKAQQLLRNSLEDGTFAQVLVQVKTRRKLIYRE